MRPIGIRAFLGLEHDESLAIRQDVVRAERADVDEISTEKLDRLLEAQGRTGTLVVRRQHRVAVLKEDLARGVRPAREFPTLPGYLPLAQTGRDALDVNLVAARFGRHIG